MNNILSIASYLLVGGVCILFWLNYTTTSQAKRVRYQIGAISLVVIWGLFSVLCQYQQPFMSDGTDYSLLFCCVFVTITIAQLVIVQRAKPVIARSKFDRSTFVIMILGAAFILVMAASAMQPHKFGKIDHKPIYDAEYFYTRSLLLIIFVSGLFSYITAMGRRNIFYAGGILYNGMLWDWSSFKTYAWRNIPDEQSIALLFLKTNSWLIPNMRVKVDAQDKPTIEALLIANGIPIVGLKKAGV